MAIVEREWVGESKNYHVVYRHHCGDEVFGLDICIHLPPGHPLWECPISDPRFLPFAYGLSLEIAGHGKRFEEKDNASWWVVFGGFDPKLADHRNLPVNPEAQFSKEVLKEKARLIVSDLEALHKTSKRNVQTKSEEEGPLLSSLESSSEKTFEKKRGKKLKVTELTQ